MPKQDVGSNTGVAYYVQGDTWPPLTACLADAKGPIDLTGSVVRIQIAYSKDSYYYSPTALIVPRDALPPDSDLCVVDPDQVANKGWVSWTPVPDALEPPGQFEYRFKVTLPNGGIMTVPQNRTMPLIIKADLPGFRESVTGAP